MHTCFAIPDIFRLICDEIRFRIDPPHSQSDLASLARTCRALSEIALDSLWYEIEGIYPLIMCMPRDLWETDGDQHLILKRPLKHSDIHVLRRYAQRVRSFQSEILLQQDSSLTGAYRALFIYSHDHLLPRLEQLRWDIGDAEIFSYLRVFLSPTLKVLDMTFDMRHKEQLGFLSTIPVLSPTITKLKITLDHPIALPQNDLLVRRAFPDALQAWYNLSNLELFALAPEDIFCAAQLPKLKRLLVLLAGESLGSSQLWLNPSHTPQLYYPALESLVFIHLPSVKFAVQFFKVLQSAKLSSLELSIGAPSATLDSFRDLFSILAERCDPSSLKVFRFASSCPVFLFSDLISPLFVFSELREVRLTLTSPVGFSEEQMTQVASAWPHLEVLQAMGVQAPGAPRLQTTLSCLVPLATGCLELRELHIWIDASDGVTRRALRADPGKTKGAQNWALRRLDVQNYPSLTKSSSLRSSPTSFQILRTLHLNSIARAAGGI